MYTRLFFLASGNHYYANRSTGETSWEPPLPPPPPRFPIPPPPSSQPSMTPLYKGMIQQNFIVNQQHQIPNQPPQFNPSFPPPPMLTVGQNANPIDFPPPFPPPQPMIPSQLNKNQTVKQTTQTSSKVGYHFDSTTATTPGLLVTSVRSMMNTEMTKNPPPKLELEGLPAGAIADLCNVTNEFRARSVPIDKGDFANAEAPTPTITEDVNQYYMPLEPFALPVTSRPALIETGRVDIRLNALYSKLNRI